MTYDPADNSRKCHAQAIASMREIAIRKGHLLPSPDRPDEQRWAREGFTDMRSLDTVRRAPRPTNDNAEAREVRFEG